MTDVLLPIDAGEALEPHIDRVSFATADCIFREGAPSDCCYFLDRGEVRLEVKSQEVDTDAILGYISSPSILGELGLLDGLPRSASAFAECPVSARRLSSEGLDRLCREAPSAGSQLLRSLGRDAAYKLRRTTERVASQPLEAQYDAETDQVVRAAVAAQAAFAAWEERRVDALLKDIARAVDERAEALAAATVAETGMGNVADKAAKNRFAALGVYETLVGRRASGTLGEDAERKVTEIASPVGVVFGLIPLTNPVATIVNKVMICLKARNAVILSCHREARAVADTTGKLIRSVLVRHGAPSQLVQWLTGRSSRQRPNMFMRHPGVRLILATGGPAMVRAAYSAGKPAIGVGSGNAPALICADADLARAASAVVTSKAFDYGVICGSEQHLVVERSVLLPLSDELRNAGAALLDSRETAALLEAVFDPQSGALLKAYAGRSAQEIAARAGLHRNRPVRVIVFPASDGDLEAGSVSRARLPPLLSLFVVDGFEAGIATCQRLLAVDGTGHTAAIHTRDRDRARRFALSMPASRILVNLPAAQGCVGMGNGLTPSLTLGCGTFGGNSTTDNISYSNLLNVKRIAEPLTTGREGNRTAHRRLSPRAGGRLAKVPGAGGTLAGLKPLSNAENRPMR